MEWLILIVLLLLPAYPSYRLVRARRAGWAWSVPLVAAGLGVLGVLYVESVAISEQSRTFGSFAFLLFFGVMALTALLGCIAGHVARWLEAGMRGERDR
jgi:hypothetical protein